MKDYLLESIKEPELKALLQTLLDIYLPVVVEIPRLRDNPKMLFEEVKATAPNGITDVATVADVYVQDELKSRISKANQDWQFWGEEGTDRVEELDRDRKYLFVTDPIEGTNNFKAKKDDQWGSIVALVDIESGEPIIGIVAHPSRNTLYIGVRDNGAYKAHYDEDGSINTWEKMSTKPEIPQFTYNNSPHFEENLLQEVQNFFQMGRVLPDDVGADELDRSRKTVVISNNDEEITFVDPESGALEAVRYRGTLYFKTSAEMAAVFVIIEELGGKVSDAFGKPWSLGINTLIAARDEEDYVFLKSLYDKTKLVK